tara:strand:+ start:14118 stop:14354 length:237 start_codon:yes stop_codon:yes gene_type:complete
MEIESLVSTLTRLWCDNPVLGSEMPLNGRYLLGKPFLVFYPTFLVLSPEKAVGNVIAAQELQFSWTTLGAGNERSYVV